jgi:hypothetical protein
VGIPKEKIDTIFDSFLKTISTIKENLRTWIRLVYCKDISGYARRNNKMVGKGTSCIITLDFDIIESGRTEVLSSEPIYDLGGKTILVVEDNAMNQMVIKMITKNG